MPDDPAGRARLRALAGAGLSLAQSTTTGRILLSRVAETVEPGWIPPPWDERLTDLLGAARRRRPDPLGPDAVAAQLQRAWGVRAVCEVLDDLSSTPVRLTATGQVHRARRRGVDVAVKLVRPGLADAVRQDLALAGMLLGTNTRLLPREALLAALDAEDEAVRMRRAHRALRGGPVIVPAPLSELCRTDVLVSEWVHGRTLDAAGSVASAVGSGHDRRAGALVHCVLGAIRTGVVPADLAPSGVLVLDDDRIALLDLGLVATCEPETVASACAEAVEAFIAGDYPALAALLGNLGGPEPSRLDGPALGALISRGSAPDVSGGVDRELADLARRTGPDLLLGVALVQLLGLLLRLGACGVWRDLALAGLSGA